MLFKIVSVLMVPYPTRVGKIAAPTRRSKAANRLAFCNDAITVKKARDSLVRAAEVDGPGSRLWCTARVRPDRRGNRPC